MFVRCKQTVCEMKCRCDRIRMEIKEKGVLFMKDLNELKEIEVPRATAETFGHLSSLLTFLA